MALLIVVGGYGRADAAIDLTADWHVLVQIDSTSFVVSNSIVQTGTALEIFFVSPTPTYTGTIDVDTGVFSFGGVACPGAPADSFSGTAAMDGKTYTATGTAHAEISPGVCAPVQLQLTGVRSPCGDGILDPGEACDDGNNVPNDCCSPACGAEPAGNPCSDGNPLTCERCDVAGLCQTETCPPLDLTGTWLFGNPSSPGCLEFTQAGSNLSASYCSPTPTGPYSGTIDLYTGVFVLAQPSGSCFVPGPPFCILNATASLDGSSWTGNFHCSQTVPPSLPDNPCGFGDPFAVTGTRERCGDGYINSATGEQCDDGNTAAGDCCSPTCQYEPAGSACSDANPATCTACDATGSCVPLSCPFVLDHYKCYQGSDLGVPPFSKQTVSTSDQISAEPVLAQRLKYVCTPVDKNGEGINDPAAHLACYQVQGARLNPRPRAQLSSQFQISQFELKKPQLLCVPATKTVLP